MHCDWTMPTPKGSYYRLLHELFTDMGMAPAISVTCETFMACTSLVAQSDFISILSLDVISDPILGNQLMPLNIKEKMLKATFYLIQRKGTTLTPMGHTLRGCFGCTAAALNFRSVKEACALLGIKKP